MKSVIIQGATVAKAIDEALAKAGMPQEFFIKVLEEAQPGFLGFGSKKAKIALFFKKDNGRRDGSLLSRGTYKNLFGNESLQAQSVEQEKQDKIVEKKEVVPAPQPRKVEQPQRKAEVQQPQSRKVELQPRKVEVQQPRKIEQPRKVENQQPQSQPRKIEAQQPRKTEAKPISQPEQKKPVLQRVPMQRPLLNQRPLKFTTPKAPEAAPVISSLEVEKQQEQPNSVVESIKTDAVQAESQNKRPRRRRHYGYRSKAPIQWGKSQDESEQSSDERHDSESK